MTTGSVDSTEVISILNRLRIAPKSARAGIIQELVEAADKIAGAPATNTVSASIRETLLSDLNESLRSEKDHERRRGILTAMMRIRTGMKSPTQ